MRISYMALASFALAGCISVAGNNMRITGRVYIENAQAELLHGGATMELSNSVGEVKEVRLVGAPKYIYAKFEEFDGATVEVTGSYLESMQDGPTPFRVSRWSLITPPSSDWSRRNLNEAGDVLLKEHPNEIAEFLANLRAHISRRDTTGLLCKDEGDSQQHSSLMNERAQWLFINGRNSLSSKIAGDRDVSVFERSDSADAHLQEYVICMGLGAGELGTASPLFPLAAPKNYGCFIVWLEGEKVCPVL